jgi:hypothetical protein
VVSAAPDAPRSAEPLPASAEEPGLGVVPAPEEEEEEAEVPPLAPDPGPEPTEAHESPLEPRPELSPGAAPVGLQPVVVEVMAAAAGEAAAAWERGSS